MKYDNITRAVFRERPNRFIAIVEIESNAGAGTEFGMDVGPEEEPRIERVTKPRIERVTKPRIERVTEPRIERVHVKNTGRCGELLVPGAEVYLTAPGTPGRKTKYDLVTVRKSNGVLFNIDSQAPNRVVKEWLEGQGFDWVSPEYTWGNSRLDFYMEKAAGQAMDRYLMEVKGCTLEIDGVGYFPDAPTQRGVKHVRELIRARQEGYKSVLAFAIQMDGVMEVRPNEKTDPDFAQAIADAKAAGVEIWHLPCHIEPDSIEIKR